MGRHAVVGEDDDLTRPTRGAADAAYPFDLREPLAEVEWVRRIGRAAGWAGEVVVLADDRMPAHLRMPLDLAQDLAVDSARIRAELGYVEPTDPDEAMRRTVAW